MGVGGSRRLDDDGEVVVGAEVEGGCGVGLLGGGSWRSLGWGLRKEGGGLWDLGWGFVLFALLWVRRWMWWWSVGWF